MSNLLTAGMLFSNRYLLQSQIGEGGIGQVWLAEDIESDDNRLIAIKLPKPEYRAQARFIAEAELMGKLAHNNIIKIYEMGNDLDYGEFYTMEYFPNGSLVDYLIRPECEFAQIVPSDHELKYVNLDQAIRILRPIAQALDHVHQNYPDILHRDLKLSNILIDQQHERYVLTDFSLQVGAPSIMSPEQLLEWKGPEDERQSLDWRSDLFSFGACLYKLTTGTYPFQIKASPDSLQAVDEIYRYQLVDKIPVDYPSQRNAANVDLQNKQVDEIIWRLVSKSRTGRTLNGQVSKTEDALDVLAQAQAGQQPKRKNFVTPLFAIGVLIIALLLLACGVLISGLAGNGDTQTPAVGNNPATQAIVFVTEEPLSGYPTSTPTHTPVPPPTPEPTAAPPPTETIDETEPPVEEATEELPPEEEVAEETPAEEVAAEPEAPPLQCDEGMAIFNPPSDLLLTEPAVFKGAVPPDNLDYYKIEVQLPNSDQWNCCLVDPTYGEVNPEQLGQWDITNPVFESGEYGLRLVAVKLDGNFNICESKVTVQK